MNTIHYNQLNEAMSCKLSVNPESVKVGMMATMYAGSDRYMMIVVAHPNKNSIVVEHYDYSLHGQIKTINGIEFADASGYNEREIHAQKFDGHAGADYTWRKNNRWMPKGCGMWGTCSVHVGKGDEYRDPNF